MFGLGLPSKVIIFDLQCDQERKLEQLGAVAVESQGFVELSPFIAKIGQDDLDFPKFLQKFSRWCSTNPLYCFDLCKDGVHLFGRDMLIENCKFHGLDFPFAKESFCNINNVFIKYGVDVLEPDQAFSAFGTKPKYRMRSPLNNVRGLIAGLKLLKERL